MESLLKDQNPHPLLDPERLRSGDRVFAPEDVIRRLRPHITKERADRIEAVVSRRTYGIAPVVEGLADTGNVGAVMRSAEALGIQPVHVVTGTSRYRTSRRTTQGADRWLDVFRWDSPESCVDHLRKSGYLIAATHLRARRTIQDLEFANQRIALVFGNEKEGISDTMLEAADVRFKVPMAGFAQSFNISVAAAICLYHIRRERFGRYDDSGDLSPTEQAVLRADFYLRSVKESARILRQASD